MTITVLNIITVLIQKRGNIQRFMWEAGKMFKGNKIYYITAVALAFCLWAADYGLTAAGY